MLELRGVTKTDQKDATQIRVLDSVSFALNPGDMVSVVGASGAGKSTLLHILGTLDQPDSGEVFFEGQSLSSATDHEMSEFRNREIGFVFQFHHLLPDFSALENVMMPALIQGISRNEAREMAKSAVDTVGLSARIMHKPGELSGGEQQRIALARALVMRPKVLLADEVTGNLDEKTGASIHALLQRLNEDLGLTQVIVTHNRELAGQMRRQLCLENGDLHTLPEAL